MMRFRWIVIVAAMTVSLHAEPPIVPRPLRVDVHEGRFVLGPGAVISCDSADDTFRATCALAAELVGVKLASTPPAEASSVIRIKDLSPTYGPGGEGHEIRITPQGIEIQSASAAGAFYGVQTLHQMLMTAESPGELPSVTIQDAPRYLWRGMLLDCCRHFMTTDFVKRYIDLLALHKMNVLHWHITEDQGWRIAIERYPKLTEVGAWRGTGAERYGGFYTKDDIRDIVAYAAARHITVVPEIEMPGHARAALASYPELSCTGGPHTVATEWGVHEDVYCAGNDAVFVFLEHVLDEVLELFPSTHIHIGGDECPKTRWKGCAKCQQRIADEGLADEHELQSWFIKRIAAYLHGKGRQLIGWDEILEGGLAPGAIVQSWRGMNGAVEAARQGHAVIASPTSHCYLDYSHATTSLEQSYSFDPTPDELTPPQARLILGLEGNMWTERAPQERVDRQVFPRLCALAEAAWTPDARRSWPDFARRMGQHYRRLDALGVDYHIAAPACATHDRVFSETLDVELLSGVTDGSVHVTLDGTEPTAAAAAYDGPLTLTASATLRARLVRADGRSSDELQVSFRKMAPRPPEIVGGLRTGWRWREYHGDWRKLPDTTNLTPVANGLHGRCDVAVAQRSTGYTLVFDGYIDAPAAGIYTFWVSSDDGSRLWIGDDLVVDNDGLHGMVTRYGQAILQAGRHPIRVAMFQAGGAHGLRVEFAGPGIERREIPGSAVGHLPE